MTISHTDGDKIADALRQCAATKAALDGRLSLHQSVCMRDCRDDNAIAMARQDVIQAAEEVCAAIENGQRLAQALTRKQLGA